jgi:ribokinase
MRRLKIGVIGHVEHITLGRVRQLPGRGDIAHLESPEETPGGGGGIAFYQLVNSDAEIHLFTALGNDDAAELVSERLVQSKAIVHWAFRDTPHTRDVVMIDPAGERTIVVVGEPLHPTARDPLPWHILGDLDAVYFTAQDPELLFAARRARNLLVTARRKSAIEKSGVIPDVIVGSKHDPREASTRLDYPKPPRALVMTEGKDGGSVETEAGVRRFTAPHVEDTSGGAYGAGDSFAGALTFFIAAGLDPLDAAQAAAPYGASVLAHINPIRAQKRLVLPSRES